MGGARRSTRARTRTLYTIHNIALDAIHLLFCFERRVQPSKTF